MEEDLKKVIRAQLRDELKAELEATEMEILEKKSGAKVISFKRIIMAAAAVVLLLVGVWFMLKNPTKNSTELYAQYYQPFDNVILPVNRSTSDVPEGDILQQAFISYENGAYPEAEKLFSQLPDSLARTPDIQFYQSLVLLENNKNAEAQTVLEELVSQNNFQFQKQAEWYLALVYLKIDEQKKMNILLEKISKDAGHPFEKEAKELSAL